MNDTNDSSALTATDIRLALSEVYPDAAYGAIPVVDKRDALETYRAFVDGGLATIPEALAAYVDSHQLQWL